MTASTFDTLAAADELRDAGFDDKQVHAIIEIHRRAGEPLATRADVKATRADVKATRADLKATKADLNADLKALEGRLYRALWIQGTGIVLVNGSFIAIAAALRLF